MHCSRRSLLRRGLEFHVCTINKRAHTKKVWKLIVCTWYISRLYLISYFLVPVFNLWVIKELKIYMNHTIFIVFYLIYLSIHFSFCFVLFRLFICLYIYLFIYLGDQTFSRTSKPVPRRFQKSTINWFLLILARVWGFYLFVWKNTSNNYFLGRVCPRLWFLFDLFFQRTCECECACVCKNKISFITVWLKNVCNLL